MQAKFAKALAENIALIAGNVAHVALLDAGVVKEDYILNRAQAVANVDKAKRNIASLLMQPGTWKDDGRRAKP